MLLAGLAVLRVVVRLQKGTPFCLVLLSSLLLEANGHESNDPVDLLVVAEVEHALNILHGVDRATLLHNRRLNFVLLVLGQFDRRLRHIIFARRLGIFVLFLLLLNFLLFDLVELGHIDLQCRLNVWIGHQIILIDSFRELWEPNLVAQENSVQDSGLLDCLNQYHFFLRASLHFDHLFL